MFFYSIKWEHTIRFLLFENTHIISYYIIVSSSLDIEKLNKKKKTKYTNGSNEH